MSHAWWRIGTNHDDLREVFDLDSMDFANLVGAIHNRLKVNIPKAD
jgi:acyl carrier protein